MDVKTLGQTGVRVSHVGLGMAALGRPGYINLGHGNDLQGERDVEAMRARAHAVLDHAWLSGVRYFDAARSYGRAEEFLGGWMQSRNVSFDEVAVGSKWGYTYTANWRVEADKHEVKEHSAAVLRRQIRESQRLLGAHLKLYQIHSATLESGVLTNDDVLDELVRLRDAGTIIGLSLSGPKQADTLGKAMTIRRGERPLFQVVQATWNVLERSAEDALREARDAGMGVIVKEVLANGRLTDRNDEPEFRDKRAALQKAADAQNVTVDVVALAAALAQPWAGAVLSGASTIPQLQSNLRALKYRWNDATKACVDELREESEAYWQTRSRLTWN